MRDTQAGASAVRLLAVLAAVLGLLAMHGVASSHHAAAAVPGHTGPLAVGGSPHLLHAEAQPTAGPSVRAGGAAVPWCDDDCAQHLTVLCAAVLVAVVAAATVLAAAARIRWTPVVPRTSVRARAPAASRWCLPRVDPVAELCVSRT